ncbi:MAG: hypothetical protein HQ596_07185 [Candidatus Saganbacteria bacterium]|nr:hypothetical protein [Candidatus Saganbacteria bacterium]
MKALFVILILIFLVSPSLGRPFDYNFSLGPEYWASSSSKSGTNSSLVTGGFAFSGNIRNKINAGFSGAIGETGTAQLSFSDISILYNQIYQPDLFLGYGISLLTYNNVLNKTTDVKIDTQQLDAKLSFGKSFSSTFSLLLSLVGPSIWGADVGLLAYFDPDFGDFNFIVGYKYLRFDEDSTIGGIYLSSSIYF